MRRLGLAAAICLLSAPAFAEANDRTATALADKAMNSDYLETRFAAAVAGLRRAIASCESGACSAKVRARLWRDLGVVQIAGLRDAAGGTQSLEKALAADAAIELDPAFTTPDVKRAFDAAHSGAEEDGAAKLEHEPVREQRKGRPIPIYVEAPEGVEPKRVKVHYRSGEAKRWHAVKLRHMSEGWGGEIPCDAIQGTSLRYYVDATDDDDALVAAAGSEGEPFEVEIVDELEGRAPRLPGRSPPKACSASGEGDAEAHAAVADAPPVAWLGLHVQQDLALVSGDDVCTRSGQVDDGFSCFRESGSQYHGTPAVGAGDKVSGGFAPATTRFLLGAEWAFGRGLSAGTRIGWAIGGAPRADNGKRFLPLHFEARAAWWPTADGIDSAPLAPFLLLTGGLAQVDSKRDVRVNEDRGVPPPASQIDNPDVQDLHAYKKLGSSFTALGGGAFWRIGDQSGFLLDVKWMFLFPSSGSALALEAGWILPL